MRFDQFPMRTQIYCVLSPVKKIIVIRYKSRVWKLFDDTLAKDSKKPGWIIIFMMSFLWPYVRNMMVDKIINSSGVERRSSDASALRKKKLSNECYLSSN